MFKQKRLWVFGFIIVLILASCSGDTSAPTATPLAVDQNFHSNATGGTLAFQYPTGWVTSAANGQVIIANSQAAMTAPSPAAGQFNARMVVGPIGVITNLTAESSAQDVIQYFANSLSATGIKFSTPTDLRIGSFSAAEVNSSSRDGQGSIIAVNMNDGIYNIVSSVSAAGELANFEPTLWAILATVSYTPPKTDTPDTSGNLPNAPAVTSEPGG